MTKKTKSERLADYKKSNQERKLVLANREGYSTKEEYLNFLTGKKTVKVTSKSTIKKSK